MKPLCWCGVAAVVVGWLSAGMAAAGGFVQRLPEPGTETTYFVHGRIVEQNRELQGTLAIRALPPRAGDPDASRWVEMELRLKDESGEVDVRQVGRMLAPVKEWTRTGAPLENLEKSVLQVDDGDRREQVTLDDFNKTGIGLFLRSGRQEVKTLEQTKTISVQRGTLKCAGERAEYDLRAEAQLNVVETLWLSNDVPTGVAGGDYRIVIGETTITLDVTYDTSKTGAQSALP